MVLLFAGASGTPVRASLPSAAGRARLPALIPTPGELLPSSNATVKSSNWSGYAVTSRRHRIAAVSSAFVVPTAKSSPIPEFAATWAGIGGYKTGDLIQAGTAEDSTGGIFGPQYFAWYELLPNPEQPIGNCRGDSACTVRPGEQISVTIRRLGSGRWQIFMNDQGHWRWTKRVHYNSSRSSAEWILEAPSINGEQSTLAHVGTVRFGPTSRYTVSGGGRAIGGGRPIKIVLVSRRTHEATPSPLAANRQSFNDCSYRRTCPRP
jgi:hypothetical protein